jgi:hypothetical protein
MLSLVIAEAEGRKDSSIISKKKRSELSDLVVYSTSLQKLCVLYGKRHIYLFSIGGINHRLPPFLRQFHRIIRKNAHVGIIC